MSRSAVLAPSANELAGFYMGFRQLSHLEDGPIALANDTPLSEPMQGNFMREKINNVSDNRTFRNIKCKYKLIINH